MTILDLKSKLDEKKANNKMGEFLKNQLVSKLPSDVVDEVTRDAPVFISDPGLTRIREGLYKTTDDDIVDFNRLYKPDDESFKGSRGAKKLPDISYRDLSDIMVRCFILSSGDGILETLDEVGKLRYDDVYTVADNVDILHFLNKVLESVEQHEDKT